MHEQDIVHRDIKPANLMIVPDPAATGRERLKGARLWHREAGERHRRWRDSPRSGHGQPALHGPRAVSRRCRVDSKADCYAVGAVLYHLLAGQPPFDGETFAALVFKHLHEPLTPLSDRGVAGPPALLDVVHALLAKDPKSRPTMRDTANRLESLLGQLATTPSTLSDPRLQQGHRAQSGGPRPEDATRLHIDLSSTLGRSVGQAPEPPWTPSRRLVGAGALAVLSVPLLLFLFGPERRRRLRLPRQVVRR